jgi:hypothetical protein
MIIYSGLSTFITPALTTIMKYYYTHRNRTRLYTAGKSWANSPTIS